MDFLYSEEQLERFLSFFFQYSPLEKTDKYFLSMACRKKYINNPEEYSLNGTSEMFERKLVMNDVLSFKKLLLRYNKVAESYTDKNGKIMPEEGFCIYLNINPTNIVKTYYDFTNKMNLLLQQITLETLEGKICDRLIAEFMPIESNLHTAMQKSRLHKNLIDIDIDDKEKGVVEELHKEYEENNVTHLCIETHGGYHLLLVKNTIKYNFHASLKYFQDLIKKEVCINSNEMIPLVGTLQGTFPVRIKEVYSSFTLF